VTPGAGAVAETGAVRDRRAVVGEPAAGGNVVGGVEPRASRAAGTDLAAVRRLDWRFLLPSPDLGRVASVGAAPPSVVAALEACGAEVVPVGDVASNAVAVGDGRYPNGFDHVIVFLTHPVGAGAFPSPVFRNLVIWQSALDLLRPGGWLVVEVHGLASPRGLRRPVDPRAWAMALARLGLSDVAAHWHWPDFERCTQIVPLGEPAALSLALARTGTGFSARLMATAGRLALRAGLLAPLVPCFSVMGRRPGTTGG